MCVKIVFVSWLISQNISLLMTGWFIFSCWNIVWSNSIKRKGTRGLYQHWSPHECHHTNFSQGYYGISIACHCRLFTSIWSTIWFPHQNAQDPNTWTLSHLLQLKQEYNNLQIKYNCVVQESYVVQDQSASPSDTLLLPPLNRLYSVNALNRELPHQGESRPVLPQAQHSLSR